jgi:hypothetical protein
LAGVTITVSACDDSSDSPTSPTSMDVSGTISANHGHIATVTGAQITAANAISLDIRGTATHPHTVQLTSDELSQIGNRVQVAKVSSTDNGHDHTVTFN